MEKVFTTEQAAAFLSVSTARVRQYIQENRLLSQKIGRDHIIDGSALADFAKNGRKTAGRPKKPLRKRNG